MSEYACFAYRNDPTLSKLLPDRLDLFDLLEERGITPVVSGGAEDAFDDTTVEVSRIETEGSAVKVPDIISPQGRLALHDEVRIIVNRADKTIKRLGLPPTINEGPVRSLGHFKWRAHEQVLEPAGIAMPTRLITAPEDIRRFMDELDAPELFAKPEIGKFGQGVQRVARQDVERLFADNPDWLGKYLLQPAYDLTGELPGLAPYDNAAREGFEDGNAVGRVKELRMYSFYADGRTESFPAARTLDDGDNWFFVDPESVPSELYEDNARVMEKVALLTGACTIYGAVDRGYGTYSPKDDPRWMTVEMNLRSPYLIGKDKHPGVSRALRTMHADQIATAARAA